MKFYEKTLFLRLSFTLTVIFFTIIVMIAWWQMLYHKNLDYYVLSEKNQLQVEILSGIYKNNAQLMNLETEKKIIFQKECRSDICFEAIHKTGYYQIHPEYEASIIKEKNRRFRMFISETSFLIFIIVMTIGYMFWVISREKKIQVERQEFLALTTHELKHPVSVLSLLLESLSRESLPKERIGEFLQKGMNEIKTLRKSLENILKLQEITFSKSAAAMSWEVFPFLKQIHQNWLMHDLNKKSRLRLHDFQGNPVSSKAIQADVQVILNNLVENALLYSDQEVEIALEHDNHGNCICISDHGLGFSKEDKKNYQKMFFRSKRHDIQNIQGSGLGHFIIKKLAAKNSLQVILESAGENQGSKFKVYL